MPKKTLSDTKPEHEVPRGMDEVIPVRRSLLAEISDRVLDVHAVATEVRSDQKQQEIRLEKIDASLREMRSDRKQQDERLEKIDGSLSEISLSLKSIQDLVERIVELENKAVEHDRRLTDLEDRSRAHLDAQ